MRLAVTFHGSVWRNMKLRPDLNERWSRCCSQKFPPNYFHFLSAFTNNNERRPHDKIRILSAGKCWKVMHSEKWKNSNTDLLIQEKNVEKICKDAIEGFGSGVIQRLIEEFLTSTVIKLKFIKSDEKPALTERKLRKKRVKNRGFRKSEV